MNDEPEFDGPNHKRVATLEMMRDEAISMFDRFVAQRSGMPPANAVNATMEDKQKFLTLAETENIVKEHAVITEDAYAIGGDTPDAAVKQVRIVMAALMHRILSNVLNTAAGLGLFDVSFDEKTNDFRFHVSEKGKKLNDRIQNQIDNGEEIDFDLDEDEEN
jgi:hypothetical protein